MKHQIIPVVDEKVDSDHSQIKDIQSDDTLSISTCTKSHVSTRKPITKSDEEVTHKLVKEYFSNTKGKAELEQVSLKKDYYQDLTFLKSSDATKNISLKDLTEKNINQACFDSMVILRDINMKFTNPAVYVLSAPQTHPSHIGNIPWQHLREEFFRLCTFCKYPQNTNKSALQLAKNGFAYIGSGRDGDDSVICSFCTVCYKGWQPRDEIASVHAKLRPDCPLINGKDCGNVSLSHPPGGADLFTNPKPQPITRSDERMKMDSVTEGPSQASSLRQSRQQACSTVTAYQAINTNAISSTIPSNTSSLNTSGMSSSDLNQTAGVVTGASQELVDPTTRAQNQPAQSTLENQGPSSSLPPQSQSPRQMVPLEVGNNRELTQSSLHNNTPNPNAQISRGSVHEAGNNSDPAQVHANSQAPSQGTLNNSTTGQEASNTRVLTQPANRVFIAATESQSQQPSRPATSQTPAECSTTSNSSSNEMPGEANGKPHVHQGTIMDNPKYSQFKDEVARLRSFERWPADHHLTKEVLADAGFFYAGSGDKVRCIYCGGGLSNWEQDDDVWVEHARWYSDCAFLIQTKGAAFIDAVERLNKNQGHISYQDVINALGTQRNSLDSKEATLKKDPVVIAVQSAGYSEHDAVAVLTSCRDRKSFFLQLQTLLSSSPITHLEELCMNVEPLLFQFSLSFEYHSLLSTKSKVDKVALCLRPRGLENLYPAWTDGDGNCMPRAVALASLGSQDFHVELRCRAVIEMSMNKSYYLKKPVNYNKQVAWLSTCGQGLDINFEDDSCLSKMFDLEVLETCQLRKPLGLWQLEAFCNVIGVDILSVYPSKGPYQQLFNTRFTPRIFCGVDQRTIHIMWSSHRTDMKDEYWVANHVVPLLPKSSESDILVSYDGYRSGSDSSHSDIES